jgi:hypothetical protein
MFQNKGFVLIIAKSQLYFYIKTKNKKHYEGRDEGEAHGVGTFF